MKDLLTVELKGLRFHAFHGLYAAEHKTGNEFEVNLSVAYQPAAGTITDITETINYVQLFQLVSAEMKVRRDLLETLAMELAEKIKQQFSFVKKISIEIQKMQAPILQLTGSVAVSYSKEY